MAVLPFAAESDDPQQVSLSDGLTEDPITRLPRVSGLVVVARNATRLYQGLAISSQQVRREHGVQYVLEGSMSWADDQVRITVHLVDTTTGHHV